MKITKAGGEGVTLIAGYGAGAFRVGEQRFEGSVLIVNGAVEMWPVETRDGITAESLHAVQAADPAVEILIVGTGPALLHLPSDVSETLKAMGIVPEVMDTGAAARTYNVLALEGRRVAAALIAVD
ncbi:MAG: hypothetical protein D6763_06695 [Alphaproteobacteria bacterium]|nr:MAG: hypothetical protein D6763_06695 [Alphaproteobacteria bacterium]